MNDPRDIFELNQTILYETLIKNEDIVFLDGKTPQKDGLQLQLRFVGIGCRAGTAQAHCQQHAVPPAPQRGQAEH